MAGFNPTDDMLLALANQPAQLGPQMAGQAIGLGAGGIGLAPLLGASQGALGAMPQPTPQPVAAPEPPPAPAPTMFDTAPQSVTLPLPEQLAQQADARDAAAEQEGMSGERAQALAMLAGQLPQFGAQIGRTFDALSDAHAKRDVAPADSAVDAFLRALGG